MSAHTNDYTDVIAGTPKVMPAKAKTIGLILLVIGILASAYGFFNTPLRAQASFLINYAYWSGIAMGGFTLSVVLVIVNA